MKFSNALPNLKMAFSIAFNLVSKFASCLSAATDIPGAGFILTIPDAEDIAVVVLVEGEVTVTKILLLAVVIGIAGLTLQIFPFFAPFFAKFSNFFAKMFTF